jgi:thiamine-monophosphate kinase
VAGALGVDPLELAATGGEDYELCACVPRAAAGAVDLVWIGEVAAGEGLRWLGAPPGADAWRGFEH